MKTFEFTIIATGLSPTEDGFADRFFKAGRDDATISFQKGATILEFDREAKTFSRALKSAIANVRDAGAEVVNIEPDHLVSLSDIADRAGKTRAAASNYAKGSRGKNFPAPVVRVTTESPLWDWVGVARSLYRQDKLTLPDLLQARVVRAENIKVLERQRDHLMAPQGAKASTRAA
jgi:hypothetical protein